MTALSNGNCCRAVHTFDCLSVQTNCCNAGAVAVNLSAFDIDAVRAVVLQLGGMQTAVCVCVASCNALGIFRQQGTRLEKQH